MEKDEETKCTALVHLGNEKSLVPQPSLKELLGKFSLEEILKNFTAEQILGYLQMYIPPAAPVGFDNVWKPNFFLHAAEFFKKENLPPEHIRLGLIFLVNLVSAHIGHPVVLEVIDDASAGAVDVLQRCKELLVQHDKKPASSLFWKTFNQMSLNDLVAAKADIKGKCIADGDSTKFEKGKNLLNKFLADQGYAEEETIPSKFGPISVPTEIEGPAACLLISTNPKKLILTHPSFLGIHFNPAIQIPYAPELEEREKAQLVVKGDVIKSYLQRLQHVKVKIPYEGVIIQHLQASNNPYVVRKIDMILRMLRVVTITNCSSEMTEGEYYHRWCGSDPRTVEAALDLPSIHQGSLIARKVDYCLFWMLVDGMLKIEGISFSERERRVFRVVKTYNEAKLKESSMSSKPTKFEKLAQIARSPFTWSDKLKVFELVNQDGGEQIGNPTTVYNVLQELEEKGVIKDEKDPNGRRHGFHIATWELSDSISFPHPSLIEDPVTGMDRIKVRNPITGEIDEI